MPTLLWFFLAGGLVLSLPVTFQLLDPAALGAALLGDVDPYLALGTDTNGVPGVMAGFSGPADLPTLTAALLDAGFGEDEVRGVLGGNALRVLREVEGCARTSG